MPPDKNFDTMPILPPGEAPPPLKIIPDPPVFRDSGH
jgi:hypothetical protein